MTTVGVRALGSWSYIVVVVYRGSRTHSTEVVLYLKHQLKQKTEINSRV